MELLKVKAFDHHYFTSPVGSPLIVQHLGHSLVAHHMHS